MSMAKPDRRPAEPCESGYDARAAIVAVSLGSETRPATQDDERWLETEWSEGSSDVKQGDLRVVRRCSCSEIGAEEPTRRSQSVHTSDDAG